MKISFFQRFKNPSLSPTYNFFLQQSKGLKGVKPHFCPAIRNFFKLGWVLGSPIELDFFSKVSFKVDHHQSLKGDSFLSPGIIGDPDAKLLYARVDTGLSFMNLEVPIMATKIQSIDEIEDNLIIPPNIYPAGYSGPILIAVASNKAQKIQALNPLIQLIPLTDNQEYEHTIVDNLTIHHPNFEGLYYENWQKDYPNISSTTSSAFLNETTKALDTKLVI